MLRPGELKNTLNGEGGDAAAENFGKKAFDEDAVVARFLGANAAAFVELGDDVVAIVGDEELG